MKKSLVLLTLLFVFAGCSKQEPQVQEKLESPIQIIKISEGRGDEVPDTRDPMQVCQTLKEERAMSNCNIIQVSRH